MAITFDQVSFTYQAGTPFATPALHEIQLTIPEGQVTAIVGHTGSGKSTLMQLLDGLETPTAGTITFPDGTVVDAKTKPKVLNQLRAQVGMVFQFPEAQLFEQTVLKDVMVGPLTQGLTPEAAETAAKEALRLVGLPERFEDQSPFDLSGGQMRRVAIAGVLAMRPRVLILDEPTAGLDPVGQRELMALFMRLQAEQNLTLVLITHQMEDVGQYADFVAIFEHGRVLRTGTPTEVFAESRWLQAHQLGVPAATAFADALAERGVALAHVLDLDGLADQLAAQLVKEAPDHG